MSLATHMYLVPKDNHYDVDKSRDKQWPIREPGRVFEHHE